jgi:NAD+ synthase
MRPLQQQIMTELGVKSTIDPQDEINRRIQFLKDYVRYAHAKGFVLGISGGQDSSLAGRLSQLAVEQLREETGEPYEFITVRLPYGVQQDEEDAKRALRFIQADRTVVYNVKAAVDAAVQSFQEATGETIVDFHKGNMKARMRMIAQYAIGGQHNLLVVGTDHAAEAVTGFYTKYGDGGADILPISGLSKRQGKELLKALGAEEAIYMKVPTADLLDQKPAQADETELGLTYEQIDDYLEGKDVSEDVAGKIERRFLVTQHKRTVPVSPWDTWWK